MRTQQETFDSVEVEGVRTVYYHGGGKVRRPIVHTNMGEFKSWYRIELYCTDSYYFMSHKFKMALKFIEEDDENDYDLIFRTNSSSYVNKKALVEFAQTLPTEKLYAGWTFKDSEDFGGDCVSGAGIFLSRDTAKILMEEIDPQKEIEEDVYCGRILRKHGITAIDDKSRIDYTGGIQQQLVIASLKPYHIRFKTDSREQDIENMKIIHKLLTE